MKEASESPAALNTQADVEKAVREARETGALRGPGAITLVAVVLSIYYALLANLSPNSVLWSLLLCLFWGRLAWSHEKSRRASAAMRAALRWTAFDRENLPALIGLLDHERARIRHVARIRLITVLPTLRPGDLDRLTPEQRSLLYDQLTPGIVMALPDFGTALLQAIRRDGSGDALPALLPITRGIAWTSALRRLRTYARETLMVLERRAARRQEEAANKASAHSDALPAQPLASLEAPREPQRTPALRLVFLLAVYIVAMPGLAFLAADAWRHGDIVLAGFCALAFALAPLLHRHAMLPRHARALRELERITDLQSIGRLAEALAWPDERATRRVARALIPLLLQLRASDSRLLDDRQRDCLHAVLRMDRARRDADLQVAILAALEQVGDTRAIPHVAALAEARASTARQQRVKSAAAECLVALTNTAKRIDPERLLLRAAAAPTSPETGLVMPAGAADTPPERLVRPAN